MIRPSNNFQQFRNQYTKKMQQPSYRTNSYSNITINLEQNPGKQRKIYSDALLNKPKRDQVSHRFQQSKSHTFASSFKRSIS